MRSKGGYGVTVECGNHDAPESAVVAYRTILNALYCLGLASCGYSEVKPFRESLRFNEIYLKENEGDRLEKPWEPFTAVRKNEVLGKRANGSAVTAPSDGYIVFAHPDAALADDWIHFAVSSNRGTSG